MNILTIAAAFAFPDPANFFLSFLLSLFFAFFRLPSRLTTRDYRLFAMPFRLELTSVFSAAHAIVIGGQREPLHGHDWRVTATIGGATLDSDGLLVDFHAVEAALKAIIAPFHNRSLNETPPFDVANPTAELVAKHIGEALAAWLLSDAAAMARGVRLVQVRITEAIGCAAIYIPV